MPRCAGGAPFESEGSTTCTWSTGTATAGGATPCASRAGCWRPRPGGPAGGRAASSSAGPLCAD
eukprot:1213454-Alexandrium_andersonii.AAC.1